MSSPKFRVLFVALLLLASSYVTLGQSPAPKKINLEALGIAGDVRSINTANEYINAYFVEAAKLQKKEAVLQAELTVLEANAATAKTNVSQIIAILIGIINKVKASNNWNDNFDAQFAVSVNRASVKSGLQQLGGGRKLLEAAQAELNGLNSNIDDALNTVRAKLQRQGNPRPDVVARSASSGGFKCKAILAGIALAEVGGADRVACRLDELYGEKGCGAKKPCAS